jgi:hypothetical protein
MPAVSPHISGIFCSFSQSTAVLLNLEMNRRHNKYSAVLLLFLLFPTIPLSAKLKLVRQSFFITTQGRILRIWQYCERTTEVFGSLSDRTFQGRFSLQNTQGNYYGTGFRLPLRGLVGPGMVYFALDLLKCWRPDMFSLAELILYPLRWRDGGMNNIVLYFNFAQSSSQTIYDEGSGSYTIK